MIGTIFSKEMRRVFGDKKMIFSLFILPVILMIGIYSLMGVMVDNMANDIEDHKSVITIYQAPESFKTFVKKSDEKSKITFKEEDASTLNKSDIKDGKVDLAIGFDKNFENEVKSYKNGDAIPDVKTFYNPSEDYSQSAYQKYTGYLEQYRTALLAERTGNLESVQIFTVDADNKENVIQDDQKAGGKILGMLLPYLVSILLFAGVMSLGADSIAGEKERGTLATMLVAPVKRSQIVYGKLLSLMALSALSALVYGGAMLVAMPSMSKFMGEAKANFSLTPSQVIYMLGIIVTLVFVYVSIIALTSVFAKTIKEATSYVMPVYVVVIVCGMMTMFVSGTTPTYSYFIPIYGATMAMRNTLTQDITVVQALITIGMNLVVGVAVAGIVTRAFKSERVMFNA